MPWREGREVGADGDGVVPVPSVPVWEQVGVGNGNC